MLVDDMKSRRVEDGEGADDPKKGPCVQCANI